MSADPRASSASRSTVVEQAAGLNAPPAGTGQAQLSPHQRPTRARLPVPFVPAAALQELPEVSAQTELTEAPGDDRHDQAGTGLVVHPRAPLAVFDAAAGNAFARIRPVWVGSEAWLPVIEHQPGWVRVLLPTRPNGATGWLDASRVTTARSRYSLHLTVRTGVLRLLIDNQPVNAWPTTLSAGHGAVPDGRTFVLTCVRRGPTTPPMLLRLAAHLNGRHPGLLTIHAGSALSGAAAPSGAIGVSDQAMSALHVVPPGCLVHIDTS